MLKAFHIWIVEMTRLYCAVLDQLLYICLRSYFPRHLFSSLIFSFNNQTAKWKVSACEGSDKIMTHGSPVVELQGNTESWFDLYDTVWEWIWTLSVVLCNKRTQHLSRRETCWVAHLLTIIRTVSFYTTFSQKHRDLSSKNVTVEEICSATKPNVSKGTHQVWITNQ